jgi:myo-inositol 2-dehydrogenase / D-chiro-inositol 1-dehydrogenase
MNGPPIRAWGMGSRIGGHKGRPNGEPNEVGNIFDNFSIEFEYKNGARMISQCRHLPGCWDSVSEAIHGTKGFSQVNAYRVNKESVGVKNEVNPYVQEHTDLIASIRDGKPLNELKNVAESTMTAIFGRMAAYSGQALTWDQALNSKTVLRDVSDLKWDSAVPVSPVPIPGKFKVV